MDRINDYIDIDKIDILSILDKLRLMYIKATPLVQKNFYEFSVITNEIIKESWTSLGSSQKQEKRWLFLIKTKDPESQVSPKYYALIVECYDKILSIINLCMNIKKNELLKDDEMPFLRIISILLIAKKYLDNDILPQNLLNQKFIQNIAKDYDQKYPELKLNELSKVYTEMYELWPDRPDRDQEKPEK